MPEKTKKNKMIKNSNILLIIVSLILSFVLWMLLSLTAFPIAKQPLKNVPIDYNLSGSYADIAGISIMKKSADKVNVLIEGQRYQMGDYTADDIHIGVNLDSVRAPGSYDLPLVVTSVNGDPIDVIEMEPSTVKVDFDYMVSKTFSVEQGTLNADISKLSAAAGYIIDPSEIEISPTSVELYGPKDYIDQITSCSVTIDSSSVVQSTVTTGNTSLKMYNANGSLLSDGMSENITVNSDEFELVVPVYFRKDLKTDIEITKNWSGFDVSTIPYRIDPSSVAVKSQNENIKDIENIMLGYIDLSRITVGSRFEMNISDSSYYTNISGNDKATVYFDLEGYSSKQFTLKNSQVFVINKPENLAVTVDQDKIRNVTIVGPSDIIEKLDSSDIIAQIDMMDYKNPQTGFAIFYLTIFAPDYDNVWCAGTHQVSCSVDIIPETADTLDVVE